MKLKVLEYIYINNYTKIKDISDNLKISIGSVSNIIKKLVNEKVLLENKNISPIGIELLKNTKVQTAIILACDPGTKLWPLTDITPKSLIKVNDITIVETIIKSLIKSDIKNIYLIVGKFYNQYKFLEDKYDINIIYNEMWRDYGTMSYLFPIINNISSKCVVIDGDLVVNDNFKFDTYIEKSYMVGSYISGKTSEYCFILQGKDIINIKRGGIDQYGWKGIFYITNDYFNEYKSYINNNIYEKNHLDDDYAEVFIHISKRNKRGLHLKEIKSSDVIEIDCWSELIELDKSYLRYKKNLC